MRASCPICTSDRQHATFTARERMFGTGGSFDGVECGACGSLYLTQIPDLTPHYPAAYHASADDRPGFARRAVTQLRRRAPFRAWSQLIETLGPAVQRDAAILDVGCGSGELLASLAEHGYTNLLGIDRFAERSGSARGVRILKQTIDETIGTWDLIMFHHALEHVIDPRATLRTALERLRGPEGALLIRIPLAGDAWRTYGIDWVQLDAPRHTFVPSERGLRALIGELGGSVERIVYDSTPFQFWGSELYRTGRTLASVLRSLPLTVAFELAGTLRYGRRVRALNRAGTGDQAAFIVRRPGEQRDHRSSAKDFSAEE